MSQMSSSGWLLAFIISLLLSLLMGLALVWLSIERTDKAYSIRQLRNEVEQRAVLKPNLKWNGIGCWLRMYCAVKPSSSA
ncbi:MAG: hypothetical protein ACLUDQ_02565 [Bilophila wadsworthia]